jgi:tetratricopeptide (TPR) repeat protein
MNMSMVRAKNSSNGYFQTTGLACIAIMLAALAAYANSFSGPFIFDDIPAIVENPTIRHFQTALSPIHNTGNGVDGRPLVNLTLAINYAAGGMQVWGYHAVNLSIHILAGLTLFGIVWRTLLRPSFAKAMEGGQRYGEQALPQPVLHKRLGEAAQPPAFAVALLWTVHPLQTEAVNFVIERNELLMGLFYLLTLYCFIRGTEDKGQELSVQSPGSRVQRHAGSQRSTLSSRLWLVSSVLSCLLGMASKEVMASAPLIVLLYDRTFVAGTFRAAWRQRWRFYFGLGSTWLLLAHLMIATNKRGDACGFGLGVSWWEYALKQCQAIVHYLWLSFWPHPLIFDYGTDVVNSPGDVVPQAMVLIMLVAGTLVALWRRPIVGFAGIWFFAILAPSSSVVPITMQTMAEHRMYLPLAAVIALLVLGLYTWIGSRSLIIFAAAAVGLGWLTIQRNQDYLSDLDIWTDTVAKRPGNARAYNDMGDAWWSIGHLPEAISAYEKALQIQPDYPGAQNNLGCILANIPGRLSEAIGHFNEAFRLAPGYAKAHNNLGLILYKNGRISEAIVQLKEAVRINPDNAVVHNNLGVALDAVGRIPEAISQFEEAVWIDPDYEEAHYNLGVAFAQRGQIPEAIVQFEKAVRINPDDAAAHSHLGTVLYRGGQIPKAIAQFKEVLRIKPDSANERAFLEELQKAAQ